MATKVSVNSKKILMALQSVLNTTGPVTLSLIQDKLNLFSINDNIKVCYRIPVMQSNMTEMPEVCIDALKLQKYISSIQHEQIEIVLSETCIDIKESSFALRMNLLENPFTAEQSQIIFPDKLQSLSLGVRSMNGILGCLSGIIGKASLCDMVYLQLANEYIEAQATDVFRFLRVRIPNMSDKNDVLKLSSTAAILISKILKAKHLDLETLYIAKKDNMIYFFTDDLVISFPQASADIPMFEDILSRYSYQHKAVFDRNNFNDALKRIELVSKDNDYKYFCVLSLELDCIVISSVSANATIEERILIQNEYKSTHKIALNSRMLIDTIDKMLSDRVTIYFADELSPVLLETENVSAFVTPLSESMT